MPALEALYKIYRQHPVVCTDTRRLTHNCLFFALKGENFNGNKFAAQALEQGAAFVIIDDAAFHTDARCWLVTDVLATLQALAAHHRRQFDIPVIAVGGSNGKTTTKELVSAVLSSHYPCHYTQGNLNNHIGVPLTLLAMPDSTEVAVIEMGTNQAGDIDLLCKIAAPTHGLLTNIGKEHLEGFGSLAGVKKAEGELYRYLVRQKGCAFVNISEKYLATMAKSNPRKVAYGQTSALDPDNALIDVLLLQEMPLVQAAFLDENNQQTTVQTHLFGRHNFQNIMTAIALGVYFKVPAVKIKTALETYTPGNNRSQILRQGSTTIILDAYNANPSSMQPALQSMQAMQADHKVAILGDMLELGAESHKEHEAVLRFAARQGFDQLVLVGPEFGHTNYAKYKALHFMDTNAAKVWWAGQSFENTLILIKGSRGIRLERLTT